MTQAVTKPGRCQVRIYTENPCPRSAEVEVLGVAFCEPCAREQEAYFAIGELTHQEVRDLHSEPLAEVLERKRRERARRTDGIAAAMPHGATGVDEAKLLAFRKSLPPSILRTLERRT